MDYEWDDAKNALNRRKHGVDFMDAIAALEDPNRVEDIDRRLEYGAAEHHRHGAGQSAVRRHDAARRKYLQDHFGPEGDAI